MCCDNDKLSAQTSEALYTLQPSGCSQSFLLLGLIILGYIILLPHLARRNKIRQKSTAVSEPAGTFPLRLFLWSLMSAMGLRENAVRKLRPSEMG